MRPERMPPLLREILSPQRRRLIALRGALGYAFLVALALAIADWSGARRLNPQALALYAGLATALVWFTRRNRAWDPGYRETAGILGRGDAALEERLTTALAQEPDPETGGYSFLQTKLFRELSYRVRTHPVRLKAFGWRMAAAQGAQWVFTVALLWTLLQSGSPRVSYPMINAPIDNNAQALSVSPGSTELEKGSNLVIIATFSDPTTAPESVELVMRSPLGEETREPMIRNLGDPSFGYTLPEVLVGFDYTIGYGQQSSEEYSVSVFEFPNLVATRAEITYPKFTGWEPRTIEDTRRITAVEGSRVRWVFQTNKSLERVEWTIEGQESLKLTPLPDQPLQYELEWSANESVVATLALFDAEGRANKNPLNFRVQILSNDPPELTFLLPQGDIEVSSLEEVRFRGEAQDDWGLLRYGIGYQLLGQGAEEEVAGEMEPKNSVATIESMVDLEKAGAAERDVLTYYLWAEDYGPDDAIRRTESSLFFAEVRPFESIFREGVAQSGEPQAQDPSQSGQQGQEGGPQDLIQRQRDIISATWNLKSEATASSDRLAFDESLQVVESSQQEVREGMEAMKAEIDDPALLEALDDGITSAESALGRLASARQKPSGAPLSDAIGFETLTLAALLKTQAEESEVTQGQQQGQSGQSSSRSQRQLNNLELSATEDNYETERQASQSMDEEANSESETVDRLRELARRQEDFNQRLQELQTALEAAQDEEERERLERELKRLRDEQRQMAQDVDELESQMANSGALSDQDRERIEETREQMREAESSLEEGDISQALAQGERARRELDTMRSEALDRASSAFAEDMRQLVDQANELQERQDDIGQTMEEQQSQSSSTGLRDTQEESDFIDMMREQEDALSELMDSMREISDAAESSEPLLSERLYETLRETSQDDPAEALRSATDLAQRGFLPMAEDYEELASEGIDGLAQGIRRAAESVLGGELEGLRMARDELNELADAVREDLRSNAEEESPAGANQADGERVQGSPNEPGEPGEGSIAQSNPEEGQEPGTNPGATGGSSPSETEDDPATARSEASEGESGRSGGGAQPQNPESAQTASGASPDPQSGQPNGGGGGDRSSMADAGPVPFFELDQFRNEEGRSGPFSGSGFLPWVRRLEDVENMIFDEELREQVARVNEEAREIRAESRRHGELPQWNLVESDLLAPLGELITAIESEIAKRDDSQALAPVDREPVPDRFQETVRRYYERLGGVDVELSEENSKTPEPPTEINDAR